ncbi:MAG: CRTAC1 family protein [Hyphomicrobiales bacterium]|nr:CRTAC1 family protein [Hyphomicrobiales bacterium]
MPPKSLYRGFPAALVLLLPALATADAKPIAFVDRAAEQVFSHEYDGGWEHFVGGGVAVFDCNGDRRPDAFLAGGSNPSKLIVNQTARPGDPIAFSELAILPEDVTGTIGAYPVDIDSDGAMDLVVLRLGDNLILRGDGACGFSRANQAWGIDGGDRWTTAFTATWEDGEAFPTLAFGNYVDRTDPDGPFEACDANMLHRPTGDTYRSPPISLPGHCALSMLFSDWDRRGRADLRVSNDRHYYVRDGQEQLWDMSGSPRLYDDRDGWQRLRIWGMGIASRDITGDGIPEIYLTSMADQKLRVRDPDAAGPRYHDEAYKRGANAQKPYTGGDGRPSAGWHAAFGDIDNDGFDDLFVAKGNVEQMPDMAMDDPNNLLIQRGDGMFVEHGLEAGVASLARSRGAALADFNRDGKLDIIVVNRRANVEILENATPETGKWISVDLSQPAPNRNAVGAWIEIRAGDRHWHREVTIGGGHAGGVAGPEHFGVGDADEVEIRVTWPDGDQTMWMRTRSGQPVRVTRDAGLEVVND